jgi:hypothetical protein
VRDAEQPLERLSRIEQRLHGQFHRCLRDLHALKQHAKAYADEPDSPYLVGEDLEMDDQANDGSKADSASPSRCAAPNDPLDLEHATASRPELTESGSHEQVQNEPTDEKSVVSSTIAMTCDDTPRQNPGAPRAKVAPRAGVAPFPAAQSAAPGRAVPPPPDPSAYDPEIT